MSSSEDDRQDYLTINDGKFIQNKVDSKQVTHSFPLDPVKSEEIIPSNSRLSAVSENFLTQELQDKIHVKRKTKKQLKKEARASLIKENSRSSDSELVTNKTGFSHGLSKIFWDPWNKLGRKNKKEMKNKYPMESDSSDASVINYSNNSILDEKSLDSNQLKICLKNENINENDYTKRVHKSVRFQQDVLVIHFDGDKVIGKTLEPLKKDFEQQDRNREMRKDSVPESIVGLKTRKLW